MSDTLGRPSTQGHLLQRLAAPAARWLRGRALFQTASIIENHPALLLSGIAVATLINLPLLGTMGAIAIIAPPITGALTCMTFLTGLDAYTNLKRSRTIDSHTNRFGQTVTGNALHIDNLVDLENKCIFWGLTQAFSDTPKQKQAAAKGLEKAFAKATAVAARLDTRDAGKPWGGATYRLTTAADIITAQP